MSIAQRLQRLEQVYEELFIREETERMARKLGADPDDVLRDYYGISASIARWGPDDGVVRYLMEELDLSEEETRARFEEARREIEAEERQ